MNCCDIPPLLEPIECRDFPRKRATLDWVLHLVFMASKDMPRKMKKAYRKQQINLLINEIKKQLYAGDI